MKAMRRRVAVPKHCVRKAWGPHVLFSRSFGVHTRPRVAFARSRAYQTAPSILIRRSLCRSFLHKTKQPPRGSARRLLVTTVSRKALTSLQRSLHSLIDSLLLGA